MKKITLILVVLLINACSSSKRTKSAISSGNYDKAIKLSVKKLRKSTTSKAKQKLILLLEEGFEKAVAQDIRNLSQLELDNNSNVVQTIYETYVKMDKRQELIRPLLPLYIKNKKRDADFLFSNYNAEIAKSKKELTEYLYFNASRLLALNQKEAARNAYDDLTYLNRINPNYKDVSSLMEEAHFLGTNFVKVKLINDTNQIIPRRLEDDLLNFNSYGLNQFWTVFHSVVDDEINYDYQLQLLFKRIDVSPEKIVERQSLLEKRVKDGFEYVLDSNGNVALDSIGNRIKKDKFINVSSDFFEIHQEKATHIEAEVILNDLKTNQEVEIIPLESEFIFVYDFAEMSGDIRALNHQQKEMIKLKEVPFPSSEQMIFDTGEDLKEKLRELIDDLKI